jgi:glycosyltransferase involved in cell wall biosynthesis
MLITVFTPTYNRAYLLQRCFESLLVQTYANFEWLLVDDGSTDTTEQVVLDFQQKAPFKIRYIKQHNSGKHIAINTGVSLAKGAYFLILDSDDYLPNKALETLKNKINGLTNVSIGGVVGRKQYENGKIIGSPLAHDVIANSLSIRFKYRLKGDLTEVFKTKILQQFPFPQFNGEKFCPEALIWNRIAVKHQLYFFKEAIYVAEYLSEGLTSNIVKIRMKSPKASMLYYSELSHYKIPILQQLKAVINFWRFSFCSNTSFSSKLAQVNSGYSIVGLPLGWLLHIKDKLTVT